MVCELSNGFYTEIWNYCDEGVSVKLVIYFILLSQICNEFRKFKFIASGSL